MYFVRHIFLNLISLWLDNVMLQQTYVDELVLINLSYGLQTSSVISFLLVF
jgi:hypothetical protein